MASGDAAGQRIAQGQRAIGGATNQLPGRQMLAAARAGDWDRTGELQADCHRIAAELFAQPVSATDARAVADGIGELKSLHDEVMQLCRSARENYMDEIDGLNQGRQGVDAYTANSG